MSNFFKRLKEIKALPETLKKVEETLNSKIAKTESTINQNFVKLSDTFNKNVRNLNSTIERLEKDNSILQDKVIALNKKLSETIKETPILKYSNMSNNPDPDFAYEKDSAFDAYAWINKNTDYVEYDDEKKEYFITLNPSEHRLINTGLRFELFDGVEMQVRTRSGCANKYGLVVMNTPGTVDNQYRGNILINAWNTSKKKMRIYNGERIAQCAICPVMYEGTFIFERVDKIEENTKRSSKGIGSTGM